jgi:DNA-3-methyladenine glycosylase
VTPGKPLPSRFYGRDAAVVAVDLLNKVLEHDGRRGRIVEVEAYLGADDAASHAYRGETRRNSVMFGPPGHLYTYFTYGMHWCCNVVTGPAGIAQAVLIRALSPLEGLSAMRSARPGIRRDRDLTNGPAKLCSALGIDGRLNGVDLRTGPVRVLDDGTRPPTVPGVGVRVGISKAADLPLRFWVSDDPHVSR